MNGIFVLFLFCCFGYITGQFIGKDNACKDTLTAVKQLEKQIEFLKLRDEEHTRTLESQAHLIKRLEESILTNTRDERRESLSTAKRFVLGNNDGLVAFTAKITTRTVENVDLHDTILFPTVDLNAGNGYDPATGMFVAPTSGVYMFSLSLLAHNSIKYVVHGEIVHNKVPVARALAVGESLGHRDQGAVTVLINLLQNDVIRVRNVDFYNVTVGGDMFSVFSGYLLWST